MNGSITNAKSKMDGHMGCMCGLFSLTHKDLGLKVMVLTKNGFCKSLAYIGAKLINKIKIMGRTPSCVFFSFFNSF